MGTAHGPMSEGVTGSEGGGGRFIRVGVAIFPEPERLFGQKECKMLNSVVGFEWHSLIALTRDRLMSGMGIYGK